MQQITFYEKPIIDRNLIDGEIIQKNQADSFGEIIFSKSTKEKN